MLSGTRATQKIKAGEGQKVRSVDGLCAKQGPPRLGEGPPSAWGVREGSSEEEAHGLTLNVSRNWPNAIRRQGRTMDKKV